jgi:hypothetical protein
MGHLNGKESRITVQVLVGHLQRWKNVLCAHLGWMTQMKKKKKKLA